MLAYTCGDGSYGERWRPPNSWIELTGFLLLWVGLLLYCGGGTDDPREVAYVAGEERLLPTDAGEVSDKATLVGGE